jgi:hypothetical protein
LWFDKGRIADLQKLRGSSWVEKTRGGQTAFNRQQEEHVGRPALVVRSQKEASSPASNRSEH